MLVSKSAIVAGALVSHSLTSLAQSFVSADLATRFNVRRGVGHGDYFKKGCMYTLISPRVRPDPLPLLRSGVTKDREEDSETSRRKRLLFSHVPPSQNLSYHSATACSVSL